MNNELNNQQPNNMGFNNINNNPSAFVPGNQPNNNTNTSAFVPSSQPNHNANTSAFVPGNQPNNNTNTSAFVPGNQPNNNANTSAFVPGNQTQTNSFTPNNQSTNGAFRPSMQPTTNTQASSSSINNADPMQIFGVTPTPKVENNPTTLPDFSNERPVANFYPSDEAKPSVAPTPVTPVMPEVKAVEPVANFYPSDEAKPSVAPTPVTPVMPEVKAVEPVANFYPSDEAKPSVAPTPVTPVMPEVKAVEPVANFYPSDEAKPSVAPTPVTPIMPEVKAVEPVVQVMPEINSVPDVSKDTPEFNSINEPITEVKTDGINTTSNSAQDNNSDVKFVNPLNTKEEVTVIPLPKDEVKVEEPINNDDEPKKTKKKLNPLLLLLVIIVIASLGAVIYFTFFYESNNIVVKPPESNTTDKTDQEIIDEALTNMTNLKSYSINIDNNITSTTEGVATSIYTKGDIKYDYTNNLFEVIVQSNSLGSDLNITNYINKNNDTGMFTSYSQLIPGTWTKQENENLLVDDYIKRFINIISSNDYSIQKETDYMIISISVDESKITDLEPYSQYEFTIKDGYITSVETVYYNELETTEGGEKYVITSFNEELNIVIPADALLAQ